MGEAIAPLAPPLSTPLRPRIYNYSSNIKKYLEYVLNSPNIRFHKQSCSSDKRNGII